MSRSQTSFTGSIVTFSVPTTGFYDIVAHQLNDPKSGAEATKKNSSSRASLVRGVRKSHLSSWKEFMERRVRAGASFAISFFAGLVLIGTSPGAFAGPALCQGVGGPEVTCLRRSE